MPSGGGSIGQGGERRVMSAMSSMFESEGTRARPLKPHESEPFLTIGSSDIRSYSPYQQSFSSFHGGSIRGRPGSCDSRHSGGQGLRSTPTSSGALLFNLVSSQTMSLGKDTSRRSIPAEMSRMPCPSFTSSSQSHNHRIKMPFKHNIRTPSQSQWQEPAQELKEMTALATYHMTQMLMSDVTTSSKKPIGRLKKGRLQPLYPVNVMGPSIQQCRGILSETRAFSASASRTVQRRRQIMLQLKSGAISLNKKPTSDANDGTESVHRVSAASSVEDLRREEEEEKSLENGDFLSELASMERDAILPIDVEEEGSVKKERNRRGGEEGTDTPADCDAVCLDQDLTNMDNPDFNSPHPMSSPHNSIQEENTTTTPSPHKTSALTQNHDPEKLKEFHTDNGNNLQKDSKSKQDGHVDVNKRPLSAGVKSSGSPLATFCVKARPQTAVSMKTVRFAAHAHSSDGRRLPLSKSNSWIGKGKGRNGEEKETRDKRNSSAGSCKPNELGKGGKHDDEDEDKSSKRGGGRDGVRGEGKGSAGRANSVTSQGGETMPVSNGQSSAHDGEMSLSLFQNSALAGMSDFEKGYISRRFHSLPMTSIMDKDTKDCSLIDNTATPQQEDSCSATECTEYINACNENSPQNLLVLSNETSNSSPCQDFQDMENLFIVQKNKEGRHLTEVISSGQMLDSFTKEDFRKIAGLQKFVNENAVKEKSSQNSDKLADLNIFFKIAVQEQNSQNNEELVDLQNAMSENAEGDKRSENSGIGLDTSSTLCSKIYNSGYFPLLSSASTNLTLHKDDTALLAPILGMAKLLYSDLKDGHGQNMLESGVHGCRALADVSFNRCLSSVMVL